MSNTYNGKVIAVCPKKSDVSRTSGKQWSSQEFVIETFGQYPQKICFQIWGEDKISTMLPQIGETVEVYFDIESREFKGQWYTTAKAWKVNRACNYTPAPQNTASAPKNSPQQQVQQTAQQQQPAYTPPAQQAQEAIDDLPF